MCLKNSLCYFFWTSSFLFQEKTKFIAILEISAAAVFGVIAGVIAWPTPTVTPTNSSLPYDYELDPDSVTTSSNVGCYTYFVILIGNTLLFLFLGVVLLIGALKRNLTLCRLWIIMHWIMIVLQVVIIIIRLFYGIGLKGIDVIFYALFQPLYFRRIVYAFIKELQQEKTGGRVDTEQVNYTTDPHADLTTIKDIAILEMQTTIQALQDFISQNKNSEQQQIITQQSSAQDLPYFSGEPEEWPQFILHYRHTTEAYGFNDIDNLTRLRKCLKGDAKNAVEMLMISPKHVSEVIQTLESRFGTSDCIANVMVARAKCLPDVMKDSPETILEYYNEVVSTLTLIKTLKYDHLLQNSSLLDEFELKLPQSYRSQWLWWIMDNLGHERSLTHLAEWLNQKANIGFLSETVNAWENFDE